MTMPFQTQAKPPAPAQADYVSLEGKSLTAGNPIENNPDARLILHFKDPLLWLFRSKAQAVRGTVLVCPGGGYTVLDMRGEGENTARTLNEAGFDAAVLEYHIASGSEERELALTDALKAFRLLKSNGPSLRLHTARLDLMGYSAGGHLAARTTEKLGAAEQPDGLILIYPAYLNETMPGTTVPAVAPPLRPGRLFALIGANDDADWVKSCEAYAQAWKSAGGEAAFHLLPDGGHGFGMAARSIDSNQHWPDLLKSFLLAKPDMAMPGSPHQ
jgi:acetyl esterase/lipase